MIVTSSLGILANESKEQGITVGDVVHIRKGENHWHWDGRSPTSQSQRSRERKIPGRYAHS